MTAKSFRFETTKTFDKWMEKLKDKHGKLKILSTIKSVEHDGLDSSKCWPIKKKAAKGIYEIVVDTGPGYRVYFCIEGNTIYWLLVGGIKDSQDRDIEHVINLRKRAEEIGYDQI